MYDNLLGSPTYCPTVRRTPELTALAEKNLAGRASDVVAGAEPALLARAVGYLYTKETRSSYLIEREEPGKARVERFLASLKQAPRLGHLDEATLIRLQNEIVEPRFAETGVRGEDVYVGEAVSLVREIVHYVAPRWQDVGPMLGGLLELTNRLVDDLRAGSAELDPPVLAAVVAFGFVYLHPFGDGNGRVHRFLVHYVLARTGFTPAGLVLPVSAAILRDLRGYHEALEGFSAPLMARIDYALNEEGRVRLGDETADLYRYPDLTRQAEALYRWVEQAIDVDLQGELDLVRRFDEARRRMREIVEMPDRLESLFLSLAHQNRGQLSREKRRRHFAMLSDDEVVELERVVQEALHP